MSQDSEEIKTTEHWRWSEMQGLELVSTDPSYKTNPPTPLMAENREPRQMDSSESKRDDDVGGGAVPNRTGSGSSSGENAESVASAGFGDLFRFADGLDYFLMGIGTVGAIVHGCSLPLFLRFFADLVNSFGSNANNVDKMTQEVVKVITQLSKWFGLVSNN